MARSPLVAGNPVTASFFRCILILSSGEWVDFSECIRFANENPVTYIATVEGDQPRVRAFAMWFADNTGFYYHTGTPKSVCQQLRKNPKTELCFFTPEAQGAGRMMRVTGKVEFLEDKFLEDRLYKDRPRVKDLLKAAPKDARLAMSELPTVQRTSGPWKTT